MEIHTSSGPAWGRKQAELASCSPPVRVKKGRRTSIEIHTGSGPAWARARAARRRPARPGRASPRARGPAPWASPGTAAAAPPPCRRSAPQRHSIKSHATLH